MRDISCADTHQSDVHDRAATQEPPEGEPPEWIRQMFPTAAITCFHFAFGFRETLRLAHMLYSLARVSRRDRWGRTDHHTGRCPAEPKRAGQTAWSRTSSAEQVPGASTQTRRQLVAGGSYQTLSQKPRVPCGDLQAHVLTLECNPEGEAELSLAAKDQQA